MGPSAQGHWAALPWGRGHADASPSGSSDLLPQEWPGRAPGLLAELVCLQTLTSVRTPWWR